MSGFQSPNYTQIPNDLFDVHLPQMGYAELAVVMALCRQTFGFHRKKRRLSIRELARLTGLTPRNVVAGADQAIARGVVGKVTDGGVTLWEVIVAAEGVSLGDTLPPEPVSPRDTPLEPPVSRRDTPASPPVPLGDTPSIKQKTLKEKTKRAAPKPPPAPAVIPPAIVVVQEVRGRFPRKSCWDEIAGAVGDKADDLAFWRKVLIAIDLKDYNPAAFDVALEWFANRRIPDKAGAAGNRARKRAQSASHAAYWDAQLKADRAKRAQLKPQEA